MMTGKNSEIIVLDNGIQYSSARDRIELNPGYLKVIRKNPEIFYEIFNSFSEQDDGVYECLKNLKENFLLKDNKNLDCQRIKFVDEKIKRPVTVDLMGDYFSAEEVSLEDLEKELEVLDERGHFRNLTMKEKSEALPQEYIKITQKGNYGNGDIIDILKKRYQYSEGHIQNVLYNSDDEEFKNIHDKIIIDKVTWRNEIDTDKLSEDFIKLVKKGLNNKSAITKLADNPGYNISNQTVYKILFDERKKDEKLDKIFKDNMKKFRRGVDLSKIPEKYQTIIREENISNSDAIRRVADYFKCNPGTARSKLTRQRKEDEKLEEVYKKNEQKFESFDFLIKKDPESLLQSYSSRKGFTKEVVESDVKFLGEYPAILEKIKRHEMNIIEKLLRTKDLKLQRKGRIRFKHDKKASIALHTIFPKSSRDFLKEDFDPNDYLAPYNSVPQPVKKDAKTGHHPKKKKLMKKIWTDFMEMTGEDMKNHEIITHLSGKYNIKRLELFKKIDKYKEANHVFKESFESNIERHNRREFDRRKRYCTRDTRLEDIRSSEITDHQGKFNKIVKRLNKEYCYNKKSKNREPAFSKLDKATINWIRSRYFSPWPVRIVISDDPGEIILREDVYHARLNSQYSEISEMTEVEKEEMKNGIACEVDFFMDLFGFETRIDDNRLTCQARQILYILEGMGIVETGRDETTLYDGREWRTHYWEIKKDNVLKFSRSLKDAQKNRIDFQKKESSMKDATNEKVYDRLQPDCWVSNTSPGTVV